MDNFGRSEFDRLANHSQAPCVSVFMATHPVGRAGEQDVIRLKNLLGQAEERLVDQGMRAPEARQLLEAASALPFDPSFWSNRSAGLAVFAAPGLGEFFRVPISFTEMVSVSHGFRLRPLLPLLESSPPFSLLTVSENQVRLYDVGAYSMQQIELPELPQSLTETLNYAGADRGQQVHSAMRGTLGKQAAVFHGQGGQSDTAKSDLAAYCGAIDQVVAARLNASKRPLMLACVDSMAAIYRKESSYANLMQPTLSGNREHDRLSELHRAAVEAARPLLTSAARTMAERYSDLVGSGRTSDDPRHVVRAAVEGRVETLMYDPHALLYGNYSLPTSDVEITGNDRDSDLIEKAARETLRNAGAIFALDDLDLPTNSPLVAIFRYA